MNKMLTALSFVKELMQLQGKVQLLIEFLAYSLSLDQYGRSHYFFDPDLSQS